MKIYCCYTEAHEPLLREYFIPTLPNDMHLVAIPLEISGSGDFLSREFIDCINRKMELIQESLLLEEGGLIIWSDIDIIFFSSFAEEVRNFMDGGGHDIAFQREGYGLFEGEVNTGFIAMRCNDRVRAFYKRVQEELRANPEKNEQPVVNELLAEGPDLSWAMLPTHYTARSHGWPPPQHMVLYHANVTAGKGGVQMKREQFEDVRALRAGKRHRVCVVSPEVLGPRRNSGIGTHTHHLLKLLGSKEELDVTLLLTAEIKVEREGGWESWFREELNTRFELIENKPHPYGMVGWFNHWFIMRSLQVYNYLRRENFDVVYFQDLNGDGFICHQARQTGLAFQKAVFTTTINGPARWAREGMKHFVGNEVYEALLNHAESYSLSRSDIVIAPSQYAFDYVGKEAGWALADERRICPYMLDLPVADQPGKSQDPAIIFFGRLETRKGIHLFLAALEFLHRQQAEGVPRKTVFIGNHSMTPLGPSELVIPDFFREKLPGWTYEIHCEWDQPECVVFLDTHRDSVVVLPSIAETLGYTAIECLGLGINVIGANTGAFPDVFASPERLFEPNPRAIAAKLTEAFSGVLPPPHTHYDSDAAREAWEAVHAHAMELRKRRADALPASFPGRPRVSVCLPYFNYGNYIGAQVESLAGQTYREFELIFINDGSTDPASIRVFKELQERFSGDPRFQFHDQENAGLCVTRNRAAALAKGEYLVFCDADNISRPRMLELLVRAIETSGADCVTCHFDKFRTGPDGERIQLDHYTPVGACIEAGPFVDPFGDANCIVRKSVFDALGGFRHVPFTASEDWEFFAELCLAGYRLEVIPSDLFEYREHPESNMRMTNFHDTRVRTLYPYLRRMEPWQQNLLVHAAGAWETKLWDQQQAHHREVRAREEIAHYQRRLDESMRERERSTAEAEARLAEAEARASEQIARNEAARQERDALLRQLAEAEARLQECLACRDAGRKTRR
jgi:O-antigen biosynthesis protein